MTPPNQRVKKSKKNTKYKTGGKGFGETLFSREMLYREVLA